MEHQARALQNAGIPYTHDPGGDYNIVQLNTVFPDSLWMGLKARMQGKRWFITGTPPWRISEFFYGINVAAGLFKRWIKRCYESGDVIMHPHSLLCPPSNTYGLKKPVVALSKHGN